MTRHQLLFALSLHIAAPTALAQAQRTTPVADLTVDRGICLFGGQKVLRPDSPRPDNAPGTVLGTLPSECRPNGGRLIFAANHHARSARVDVMPDGRVLFDSGGEAGVISLDGIRFPMEAGKPLDASGGFGTFDKAFRPPSFQRNGGLCVLSGVVSRKESTGSGYIGSLPKECRPGGRLLFSVASDRGVSRVEVAPSGDVSELKSDTAPSGSPGQRWLSLDGIVFAAGADAGKPLPVALGGGFQDAGGDLAPTAATVDGKLVLLTIAISLTGSFRDVVGAVAEEARPAEPLLFPGSCDGEPIEFALSTNGQLHIASGNRDGKRTGYHLCYANELYAGGIASGK